MAINKAIIQIRRGLKDDLQFDKLLPGELAIATDAPCMWFCWAVGEVEQIPTSDNIEEVIAEIIEKYLKDNPVAGIIEIYMRVFDGYIQYSSDGETYNNLIAVSDLKGEPGERGEPGEIGVGIRTIAQTVTSTEDKGLNVYTITLTNGNASQFVVRNGSKGSPGTDGVGIQNISNSTGNPNGGKNTIKIVLSNGNVKEVYTYNGKNGSDANVTLENIVKALGFTPASEEFVNNQVSTIPKFELEAVDSLPTENIKETTVYLLKSGDESDNLYTEYIYKNGKWEKLGAQTVDLSGYAKKSTTLAGYGIADGVTETQFKQLSQEVDDLKENGGGSSVQPDYAQTDSTQPDFIKNKPFGIDWDNPTVLVENKTYSLNLDGIETSDFVLKAGPFKVVFDNVEYIREICEMEVQGLTYKIVGNLAMMGLGDDSGEPFVMASVPDFNITIIAGNDGDHLISVYEASIIKIPEKFIPNILNKTVFCFNLDDASDCYIYKDLDCTLKATREELLMALRTSVVCYGYPGVVECQALYFNDLFNKCMVWVINTASNTFSPRMLYTAEYTP